MTVDSMMSPVIAAQLADMSLTLRSAETPMRQAAGAWSKPDTTMTRSAVEHANEVTRAANTSFHYQVHDESNIISVKIVDDDSGKTIREIPPAKFLDMMAELRELVGFIVNEKV